MLLRLRFQYSGLVLWFIYEVGGLQVSVTQRYGALDKEAIMRCSFYPANAKVAHIIWRKGTHPMGDMAFYFGAATASQSPGDYFKLENRTVRGEINFIEGYHEITIVRSKESDEGLYSCAIMLKNSVDEITGGGYLILAVLPAKVPEIRDENGNALSKTRCREKNIPSKTVNGNISLVCHAFAAKPTSIITWNSQNISHLEELNRTYVRVGEKVLKAAESWIETSPNSNGHMSTIVCTVYSVTPEVGKSRRTDICLHLRQGHHTYSVPENDYSCSSKNQWVVLTIAVCALVIILVLLVCWRRLKSKNGNLEKVIQRQEEQLKRTCTENGELI